MNNEFWEVEFNWDNWWVYRYMLDKAWVIEKTFTIINNDSIPVYLQDIFAKFWSAQSPYITDSLSVTKHVIELDKKLHWYLHTILLHEILDRDDAADSMLKAERYVISEIKWSSYTIAHKRRLLEAHLWFFTWAKVALETLFKKFEKYYNTNPKEYNDQYIHYEKICEVIEYLSTITIDSVVNLWSKPEKLPKWWWRSDEYDSLQDVA